MAIKDKWFISDTHFGHANMYKFIDDQGHRVRHEFKDYLEGDEKMIQNWNSVVKSQDYVYHLGDVTFQYAGYFNNIISRLNGQKRLIVGNHDKLKNPNLFKWFDKVDVWHGFKEHNFTATHFPHRLESLRDGQFNVHGHIHSAHMEDLHYINVSVEVRNYTPVHLDQILLEIKEAEKLIKHFSGEEL